MSRALPRRPGLRGALALLGLVLAAVSLLVAARSDPPTVSERVHQLQTQLRCPVCEGLSIADSPSSTAKTMAADVDRRVRSGQTDDQVRQYYVDRYGPGILLAPAGTPGAVAVGLPLALLAVGVLGVALALSRGRRRSPTAAAAGDRELVERLRGLRQERAR